MPPKDQRSSRDQPESDAQHLRELAEMVQQSTDMISRHTPGDWRFLYASPAVTPLLGFGINEIIGMSAAELYHPDDVEDFEKRASSVSYDRGIYTHTYRFRCKNGHYTWLESTSRSIRDSQTGKLLEILVVSRDITSRKVAEEQAQRYQAEISHASRLIAMGEMASRLAHELNQPLTTIANYAQGILRLLDTAPPPTLEKFRPPLERIAQTALRSGEIIHRMRNFACKGEVNRQQLNISELIDEVLSFCEPQARQQMIELRSAIPADLPQAYGDRVQVEQVLLNLLLNAIEASDQISQPESRQILVDTSMHPNGMMMIRVQDRGPGLPAGGSERLFEQFHSTKAQGLGMGLPISRSLIEAHGGQLWAENRDGGGAYFNFTLPVSKSSIDKDTL